MNITGARAKKVIFGGLGLVTVLKSFYNVEGGHRAVLFNRISGLKDEVLIHIHRSCNFLITFFLNCSYVLLLILCLRFKYWCIYCSMLCCGIHAGVS